MHVKCNSFALKDRVGVTFKGDDPDATVPASDMTLHTFLPTQEDYNKLKERMIIIVQRILQEYSTMFRDTNVQHHIPHTHNLPSRAHMRVIFIFYQRLID